MIIFCGHFPDGALHFTEEELEDETRAEWYLRQMLGSANFKGGPLLHILSGNLGFQIEHHLFPDLPSNRYAEIAVRVRALCEKYDMPYTTGPLHQQYGQALRTIMKLSLPNAHDVARDQPEPPSPSVDRGRRTDDERPIAAYRDRRLDYAERETRHERRRDALDDLDRKWVTQCALSRICGVCARAARPAGRVPRHAEEVGRNAFHFPPMHVECAQALLGLARLDRARDDGRLRVRPAEPRGRRPAPDVPAELAARVARRGRCASTNSLIERRQARLTAARLGPWRRHPPPRSTPAGARSGSPARTG